MLPTPEVNTQPNQNTVTPVSPVTPVVSSPPHQSFFSSVKQVFNKHPKRNIVALVLIIIGIIAVNVKIIPSTQKANLPLETLGITLRPERSDSLGVDVTSAFILESKTPIAVSALESNIKVTPQEKFSIQDKGSSTYVLAFEQPLNPGKVYRFDLDAGQVTNASNQSWAFQVKSPFRVLSTLPRKNSTAVPLNSGIEITFSTDQYEDIASYFSISPLVQGRFERHKRTAVFVPQNLEEKTLYTVTLKKGMKITDSTETLAEDVVFQFETQAKEQQPFSPVVSFTKQITEFGPTDKPTFSLYSSDMNAVQTATISVYGYTNISAYLSALEQQSSVPVWSNYARKNYKPDRAQLTKIGGFDLPVQKQDYAGYIVFPDVLPKGYYLAVMSLNNQESYSFFQVTNIASYASVSTTKSLVWVHDLNTKLPIPQASVAVVGTTEKFTTDSEGMASFLTPELLKKSEKPVYVTVTASDGTGSVIPLKETDTYFYSYRSGQGADSPRDQYWSYLYLDRELYLPNDTVSYWGLIRHRDKPGQEGEVTVTLSQSGYLDYLYQESSILEKNVSLSDIGTYTGELKLPNLKPGWYTLSIKQKTEVLIQKSFSVETYTKPAYSISVQPSKKAVFSGEQVTIKGKVSFFEGSPVAKLALKYTGVSEGTVVTDENGEFSFTVTANHENASQNLIQYASLYITPQNPEEGEISTYVSYLVFGRDSTMRIKQESNLKDTQITVTYSTVTLDRLNSDTNTDQMDYIANPRSNAPLQVRIYRNQWIKEEDGEYYDFINKKTEKKYRYRIQKDLESEQNINTDANGMIRVTVVPIDGFFYTIDITGNDTRERSILTQSYVYGKGSRSVQAGLYYLDRIDKKDAYKSGEQVSLKVMHGEEEAKQETEKRYLYSFASRGIKKYELSNVPTISFPFDESYVPNVSVRAVYFTGSTYVESLAENLTVDTSTKKLSLSVSSDKSKYVPRDKVQLAVDVKDAQGKGVESEVNISLVDEALFALQGQSVDPLASLYKFVASGITESYSTHMAALTNAGGAEQGGGCFTAGTRILLPGKKTKPIEEIIVGDTVLTRLSAQSSEMAEAKVLRTWKHTVSSYLIINGILKVTPEHVVYANGRFVSAGDLVVGDSLLLASNEWVSISSIEQMHGLVDVYNFAVDTYQTYFADGFYVHNAKGRELFLDKAFFGTVRTNANGQGTVSFSLPDNLTSWRVTYQGISKALEAGSGTKGIPVSLPFFIDAVIGSEFLVGDQPVITIRTYGDGLKTGQPVDITVEAPGLLSEKKTVQTQAFSSVDVPLGNLPKGVFSITISAKSGSLEDKLIRKITVVASHHQKRSVAYHVLGDTTTLFTLGDAPAEVTFSDGNRGKYLSQLLALSYENGNRVDQKLSRKISNSLLTTYFKNYSNTEESFEPSLYQTDNGGISLFPYSDAELELSLQVALVYPDAFDQVALRRYFVSVLDDKKEERTRSIMALTGLSALQEPVLQSLQLLLQQKDLQPMEKIHLAIGVSKLGNREQGRQVLGEILADYGENISPYFRIVNGTDQDDSIIATVTTAYLGAILGNDKTESLLGYVKNNETKDTVPSFMELGVLNQLLPSLSSETVSFQLNASGKTETISLVEGGSETRVFTAQELSSIRFSQIRGSVSATVVTSIPFSAGQVNKDSTITLAREFSVNGKATTEFSATDLVRVQLNYRFNEQALDGCYDVSDYLPGGLSPLTSIARPFQTEESVWYPYDRQGQRVSFCVGKEVQRPIIYYTRVKSKGTFTAEEAVIQSMQSDQKMNISQPQTIVIR